MNTMIQSINNWFSDPNMGLLGIFIFGISFIITYFMIPRIIYTVKYKQLMDNPNNRSSHSDHTPTLAGVSFYASLMVCFFFIQKQDTSMIQDNLMVALTVLFFMGLKDDLMVLASKTKVVMQTVAIFFILIHTEFHVINFHGFFGIGQVPVMIAVLFSYFSILYIINAYNLIDGIDGFAGMLGVLISSIYAGMFFVAGLYFYFLLAIIIIGFLAAFLRYNISKRNKIFMGDTGSMIIGFLIGIMTLRFLTLETTQLEQLHIVPKNLFIISVSILFFPVIDVVRVMIIRIINKKGPFDADRRHLHHIFIDKGLAHVKASITLTVTSLLVFIFIYLANPYLSGFGLIVLFFGITFITFYVLLLLDKDAKARVHRKKFKTYIPEPIYTIEFRIRKSVIIVLKKIFYKDML